MAFDSGVFTSTSVTVNGDGIPVGNKAVSAAFLADAWYRIKGNGISLKPTSAFYVTPKTGLTCTVNAGWGIMSGYPFRLTADLDITMTSSVSEQTLYIGVRLDTVTGEYTDSNVVARTTFVAATDRVFAIIVIPANAVTLTSAMITDVRYNATYCGVVDQYEVALAEVYADYAAGLVILNAGGIPAHASNHEVGGSDELTTYVSVDAQTFSDGDQTQARTNISAAKAVSGVLDAQESAVVISTKTDNYTVTADDNGKDIWITHADAKTLTIDTQANASYPANFYFFVTRNGAGSVTIAGAGTTITSAGSRLKIAERYATVLVRKTADNTWRVTGSLSA